MNPVIEVKYINITWTDKNTALSVLKSENIQINIIDDLTYQIDAITYSKITEKIPGQIAFHILDNEKYNTPYFEVNEEEQNYLIPVTDNETSKIWWIENGTYNRRNKRRDSPICRHVGEVILNIANIRCIIQINSSSFTYDDLKLYLDDFQNDFWYLILKENSYIKGTSKKEKQQKILDPSATKDISTFIDFVTKVINNPKKELREIQSLKDVKKVRPVPRTFMEIATKGNQKSLTSRDYKDSYNVAENKYIYYITDKIYILLKRMTKITEKISQQQDRKIENYQERLESFSNMKKINKDAVENEIKELEYLYNSELPSLHKSIREQSLQIKVDAFPKEKVFVKLGKRTINENNLEFFGAIKRNLQEEWPDFKSDKYRNTKYQDSYYMISFDKNIFDKKLKSYYEYEITGYIQKYNNQRETIGFQFKRQFIFISNIKIIKSITKEKLDSHILRKSQLESANWERVLTNSEIQEQQYEIEAIKKSLQLSKKQQKIYSSLEADFTPILSRLKKIRKQFQSLHIKKDNYFPNSMTFVQNPNYQGSHKVYKEILKLSGIDEKLFLGIQEVEKIGIIDIPMIYERWVLLQIIKVLIDKFHFIPEENWKYKLMEQFLKIGKNIKIEFINEKTYRQVTLWYEKEIRTYENKEEKRPDFIVDMISSFHQGNSVHRLIMDAKFYENINDNHLGGQCTIIDKMYSKDEDNYKEYRNYSLDGKNTVFIIHPSKEAIISRKTSSEWGAYSYYGENSQCNFDINSDCKYPNHNYGAILLSPVVRNGTYLDDLQRLIGMHMQYGIEDNKEIVNDNGIDPIAREKLFCLVCGAAIDTFFSIPNKQRNGYRHEALCKECHHMTRYNYCWNCKNRLIKHGEYWSYHSAQALEPFNIKCPCCGEIL